MSRPSSSKWVAKEWRKVWQVTSWETAAGLTLAHDPRCKCWRRVEETGSGGPAHSASIIGLAGESSQDVARGRQRRELPEHLRTVGVGGQLCTVVVAFDRAALALDHRPALRIV